MALVLAAGALAAPGMADQMRMMDSMNNRLDSLVARLNRAAGASKVAAMADVINELVAQRKVMQERMHQMMGRRDAMMRMLEDSTAADTAGPAGHHPPN